MTYISPFSEPCIKVTAGLLVGRYLVFELVPLPIGLISPAPATNFNTRLQEVRAGELVQTLFLVSLLSR